MLYVRKFLAPHLFENPLHAPVSTLSKINVANPMIVLTDYYESVIVTWLRITLVLRKFRGMGDSQESSRREEDNTRKWRKEICNGKENICHPA